MEVTTFPLDLTWRSDLNRYNELLRKRNSETEMALGDSTKERFKYEPYCRTPRAVVLSLLIASTVSGCARQTDAPADVVEAAELCADALTGGGREAIEEAGWSLSDDSGPAGTARFSKGALSLSLLVAGGGRCFIDGQVDTLGGLAKARDALAVQWGPAVQETRGTFRWSTERGGLLIKLSQTYVQDREVLRLFVFRPGVGLAPGGMPGAAP